MHARGRYGGRTLRHVGHSAIGWQPQARRSGECKLKLASGADIMSTKGGGTSPMANVELSHAGAGRSSVTDPDADQERLISALRRGDEAAFIGLVERHHAMLVRMGRLYLPDCADDLAHDFWMDLLHHLDCLDSGAPLRVT